MKINVEAEMWAPSVEQQIDGRNLPIFSKKFELVITPEQIDLIIIGCIEEPDQKFRLGIVSYNKEKNTLKVKGSMVNSSVNHVEELKEGGWVIDQKAAEHYKIPRTKFSQNRS